MPTTRVCVFLCVYVTVSGCQLQLCGPEENTVSLRVLLEPLSYRCAGLLFLCVYVCVLLLKETFSSGFVVPNVVLLSCSLCILLPVLVMLGIETLFCRFRFPSIR